MTKQQPTTSDLLALRDGEPLAADVREAMAQDPDAAARLAHMRDIRGALQALPDEAPDDTVWEQIQARTAAGPTIQPLTATAGTAVSSPAGWQLRYPLATAAGVFFAAVMVGLLWLPQLDTGVDADPVTGPMPTVAEHTTPMSSGAMADLIDRSQRLEAVARLPVARAIDGQERSRQALLYRIADLDAQLNSLIEEEQMDPALKEKLWRQRVDLLETLVAVQQAQMAQSADLY